VIRAFEPGDADAVTALVREAAVDWVVSPAGLVYRLRSHPARARQRAWVAVEDGVVVAFARARLLWEAASERAGTLWLVVRSDRRRLGLGSSLFAAAQTHLRRSGADWLESFADEEEGQSFLESRGFARSRVEHVSALDPRIADVSALPALEAVKAEEGFLAVPLADAVDRPRELHAVYAATLADVPADVTAEDVRYDEWVRECLEDPDLSLAGSVVVLAAERPVALSFLMTDGAGRAASDMTGTLVDYRRRGLARLAKLASIRWAAETGIELMVTGNDDENLGMLALNRSLGYLPVGERPFYRRDA
jgi:GNAT superfamily N-acetyltransferase